jgi:hypothetical protein
MNKKPGSNVFDLITGKIGKITAVAAAVAALGVAVNQMTGTWQGIIGKFKAPPAASALPPKRCVHAELVHPKAVHLSQWSAMELNLEVENHCEEEVVAYVVFKIGGGGRIRIEPPFEGNPSCGTDKDKPGCWDERMLEKGSFRWELTPPLLTSLQDRLGQSVPVAINWVVYNRKDGTQVSIGRAGLQLQDDTPVKSAEGAASL